MNGAESLLRVAAEAGVEVCFANPGTTELSLVSGLAGANIRPVLGLFEGVCTGAADGYGRMAGKPAMTLLHLGPGLANGLANLHNAKRARTPILNVIGDHPTWHVNADPPLAADIAAWARGVSVWTRTARTPNQVAVDTAEAIQAAGSLGGIATLIVPADCQWGMVDADALRARITRSRWGGFAGAAVEAAARCLRQHREQSALLLDGQALSEQGLRMAQRVAVATGCRLLCNRVPARIERGPDLPAPERLAYFSEQLTAQLVEFRSVILVEATEPVAFFGYPDQPSRPLKPDQELVVLTRPGDDSVKALDALADALGVYDDQPVDHSRPSDALPTGRLDGAAVVQALASLVPENAILVDESVSLNRGGFLVPPGSGRHTYLSVTGGAIGQGIPTATGAAVAAPDRPVICVEADGSAMYTFQGLWTQASEGLNVTTILCSNRKYQILRTELERAGVADLGPAEAQLTDLSRPEIDWVSLARSLGVPARRASTAEEFARHLGAALAEPGPHLVQADL